MKTYTIGRLAAAAGVPASTVRYYEREGILTPDERTAGNYRQYGERALERLRFSRPATVGRFPPRRNLNGTAFRYSCLVDVVSWPDKGAR